MQNKIQYRYLDYRDINSITRCINESYNNMKNKDYFVPPTEQYIVNILNSLGKSIGAFYNNTMVGVASFVYSNAAKTSLYEYQHLCRNKDSAIQFEHGVVSPPFQGNGILGDLLQIACSDFSKLGYQYIISSVHPLNYSSLKTAFKIKQKATNIVRIYDNNIRYILVGNLQNNASDNFIDIKHLLIYSYQEIEKLMELGYCAFDIDSHNHIIKLGWLI